MSSGSTVFTCRPVADNKQYVASLHAGHKKGVISVRDRTQFPTSIKPAPPADNHDYVYDVGVKDGEFALDKAGTLKF